MLEADKEEDDIMYRIVFSGQVREGFDTDSVRAALGKMFRIEDGERLDRLFSGSPVIIKKSLDEEAARKYVSALERAGADIRVEPPLPEPEQESLADFSDFPSMGNDQDLSFNTVMQSFSNEAPLAAETSEAPAEEEAPAETRKRPTWIPLAIGAAAALLVAATFMLWPSPQKMAPDDQARLETLFSIAAEGSDAEFNDALSSVRDLDIRSAMIELRELASMTPEFSDEEMPEMDMELLSAIASGNEEDFQAAVAAEADVDVRRVLIELREQQQAAE